MSSEKEEEKSYEIEVDISSSSEEDDENLIPCMFFNTINGCQKDDCEFKHLIQVCYSYLKYKICNTQSCNYTHLNSGVLSVLQKKTDLPIMITKTKKRKHYKKRKY
jgi:hypothetical protein